jgi:hypothetical protein
VTTHDAILPRLVVTHALFWLGWAITGQKKTQLYGLPARPASSSPSRRYASQSSSRMFIDRRAFASCSGEVRAFRATLT